MLLVISGTPGTGKTIIGKKVAKLLGAKLITTGLLVKKYKISATLDKKRKTKIIDTRKLAIAAKSEAKKYENSVFEGHLAHFTPADFTIILRTSPSELERRLKKKGWSESKIRENVEAEAMDIISNEVKNAIEIDTTRKSPKKAALLILKLLNNYSLQRKYLRKIDWSEKYASFLKG
ncbi:MAG TPA: adenylate kinase family protein [archaeon]|nr:adenylate kinase family protein [archaeon]